MPSKRQAEHPEAELIARCFGCTYPRGHAVGAHAHEWDQVIFAASGVMRVLAAGRAWLVPTNRALLVPAGMRHELMAMSPVTLRTLYVRAGELHSPGADCEAFEVSPLLRELILHAVRLGRLRRDDPHEVRCLEMIRDSVAGERRAVLGVPLPEDPRALAAARAMIADPAGCEDLDALARMAGASRRTLERLFVTETGLTPARWRRRVRLLRAAELLVGGGSVSQVGVAVGYESTSAFIARFSELFGTTPGRYRSGSRSLQDRNAP